MNHALNWAETYRSDLAKGPFHLLCMISASYGYTGSTVFRSNISELAQLSGITRKTAKRNLDKLMDDGLVMIKLRYDGMAVSFDFRLIVDPFDREAAGLEGFSSSRPSNDQLACLYRERPKHRYECSRCGRPAIDGLWTNCSICRISD